MKQIFPSPNKNPLNRVFPIFTLNTYFGGQRSNIPQIVEELKEGCAKSDIILRGIGCKQS